MLFTYFIEKLEKLNPRLWVDCKHQLSTYHPDFPFGGLYCGDKYLFAVPKQYVPEWSIVEHKTGRILARGYVAIVSMLIERGLVDRRKAEKLFRVDAFPGRQNFPKREIILPKYIDPALEEKEAA